MRGARRGIAVLFALTLCFTRFGLLKLRSILRGKPITCIQRARWMQGCGQVVLRAFGIRFRVFGQPPVGSGISPVMVVSNHLSYLDIVIFAAAMPCVFVSRADVRTWPVFGWMAILGDSVFIDRSSRAGAHAATQGLAERLADNAPMLVFPEGTSTDGSEVLRFHSPLFQPAIEAGAPIVPAAVFYGATEGITERDLCWFGDDSFLPHLLKVLTVREFTAEVRFGSSAIYTDRKLAAESTRAQVVAMRDGTSQLV